jgi:hypothetical protein
MVRRPTVQSPAFAEDDGLSERERIAAFRQRQEQDLRRSHYVGDQNGNVRKRKTFYKRFDDEGEQLSDEVADSEESGEEAWRNSEGERLKDFGVDEEVDFYDDDVPLAVIRERVRASLSLDTEDNDGNHDSS